MKKILLLLFIILLSSIASAQTTNVGLYVLNLGKFDVATGAFTADFYLSMTCDNNCSSDFEFVNGRATSIDKIIDEPNEKFYRIQANLVSPVDLKEFPFDKQKIEILIEDKKLTNEEMVYLPMLEETGLDESIAFSGWNIENWSAEEITHEYKIYDEAYSQYKFTVNIERIKVNSFFKTFIPIFFMMLILMFSFIMDPDKVTTRLAMASSTLVATVMFHISISNQIPPVGYLTIADQFMVLTYFIILSAVIMNVIILELAEQKKTELVEKIHRRFEYSIFILIPVIYAIFFAIIFLF